MSIMGQQLGWSQFIEMNKLQARSENKSTCCATSIE